MKEFVDVQNSFQDFLLNDNNELTNYIVETNNVTADVRLSIYKNAYLARLEEALAANYPVLKKYLGNERFQELALEYINAMPSTFQSIRWFGDKLANFLRNTADWQGFPYLAELAQFEWACGLVFDAKNSDILTVEAMMTVPFDLWTTMCFQVQPSVMCLELSWNVVSIWQGLTEEPPVAITPEKSLQPRIWLLWRQDLICRFISLEDDEAWAINGAMNNLSFGEICEGLTRWHEANAAGQRAASLLKSWILAGLIENVFY